MKTRGKTKVDVPGSEYSKDGMDPRDAMDDGENTNGFSEEKVDDGPAPRSDNRGGRNPTARRPGRMPRVGAQKSRNDKHLLESQEFNEVVQGFFEFIEEINKRKKRPKQEKPVDKKKAEKSMEAPRKLIKPDTEPAQAQLNEKLDQQNDTDQSQLYRFRDEKPEKLIDILRNNNEKPAPERAERKDQGPWPKEAEKAQPAKDAKLGQQFPADMMGYNPYDPNTLKFLQNGNYDISQLALKQQQAQAQAAKTQQNPYAPGYENNLFKDMMSRIQLQHYGDQNPMRAYLMPQYDAYGVNKSANDLMNLQMIESLLKGNPNNLLHSLMSNPTTAAALFSDLSREMPYMMQGMGGAAGGVPAQHSFAPNRSLGAELIQDQAEAMNPRALEGKLGRAATHVAIAYFIYFKSLDADTIAKCDKAKMDPTYNSRMLKEKKYEVFGPEQAALNKLLPPGFDNFQLNNQDIQRLLEQQGLGDPLREAQLQRLQQEALLRNEDLARAALQQQQQAAAKTNEIKLEEEKQQLEARRKQNQQKKEQSEPKEEEIIEIKENSDTEEKPAAKQAAQATKAVPPKNTSSAATPTLKKPEGGISNSRAEDIVEEITELTNPSSFEIDKMGNRRKKNSNGNAAATGAANNPSNPNNAKKPAKKLEEGRPSSIVAPDQKAFEIEDDGVAVVQPTSAAKSNPEKIQEESKNAQVISSDEEGAKPGKIQEEKPPAAEAGAEAGAPVVENEKEKEKIVEEKIEEKKEEPAADKVEEIH